MQTYVLSCSNSPRRSTLIERYQQVFPYQIFNSIIGPRLGLETNLAYYVDGTEQHISAGHIGLHFSYLLLLMKCMNSSYDPVMILEDDLTLVPNFDIKLEQYLAKLPKNWEAFSLGQDTCAMIYRKSVLQQIYETLKDVCSAPIDVLMRASVFPKIRYYELSESERLVTNTSIGTETTELCRRSWKDIDGWFNYELLYDEALGRVKEPAIFVEVGSWEGKSSAYMAEGIRKRLLPVEFYCVDTWKGSPSDTSQQQRIKELGGDMFPMFQRNMRLTGNDHIIKPQRMDSMEASKNFKDLSVDFVWIDGEHTYESCLNDLLAWLPKLKPSGVIAGHDTDIFNVKKAVMEVFPKYRTWKNCWIVDPEMRIPGYQQPVFIEPQKKSLQQQTAAAIERRQQGQKPPANARPRLVLISCIYRGKEPVGEIPCGCSEPPKIYPCNHPSIRSRCVRMKEQGSRLTLIQEANVRICEECTLRENEPGTVGTVEEWRRSNDHTTFELPSTVEVTSNSQ